jgi:hypothetical protein
MMKDASSGFFSSAACGLLSGGLKMPKLQCQNFISGDFTKGSVTKIFAKFENNCLIGANSIFFWNWPDDTPNNICLLLKNS